MVPVYCIVIPLSEATLNASLRRFLVVVRRRSRPSRTLAPALRSPSQNVMHAYVPSVLMVARRGPAPALIIIYKSTLLYLRDGLYFAVSCQHQNQHQHINITINTNMNMNMNIT